MNDVAAEQVSMAKDSADAEAVEAHADEMLSQPPPTALEAFEAAGEEAGLPSLKELERVAIARTLRIAKGNRTATARALGVDRRTLYRKLARYELT